MAFTTLARSLGARADLAEATDALNDYQVERVLDAIHTHDPGIGPIGILGLAYKPDTSVVERSQALGVVARLVAEGRDVIAFDPKALRAAHEALHGSFTAAASAEECIRSASIVVLMTPWPEFRAVPPEAFARSPRMTVIDCWRLLSRQEISPFADLVYLGLAQGALRITRLREPEARWSRSEAAASLCHNRFEMSLTIAIAQVNPTVGDVAGNLAIVRRARDEAATQGADLVVFSELALVGYPPEDLVLRPALVEAAAQALDALERESSPDPALVVTLPWREGGCLHNAVALVAEGRRQLRFKYELPNYGVFDEKRVFSPGPLAQPVTFGDVRLGLPICEDIWFPTVASHLARARRRIAAGSQRVAVRGRQARSAPGAGPGTSERDRTSARVRQSGRRPGRARLRRRILRDQRRRPARAAVAALARDRLLTRWNRAERRASMRRRGGVDRASATERDLQRHDARPARLRREESLSRCRARDVRRNRFGIDRSRRRRCPRSRARARRAAPVQIHQPGEPG